jgi:hypothetical protein
MSSRDTCAMLKRRRFVYVTAIVLLLLAGWWWLARYHTYRLIGRYPCFDISTMLASRAGVCLAEGEGTYTLRDWRTGKVKWTVVGGRVVYGG